MSSNRQLYGDTIVNEMILIGTEARERDRVRQTEIKIKGKEKKIERQEEKNKREEQDMEREN